MSDEFEELPNINEQNFHNSIREYIIFLLLFFCLYVASFALIQRFKRRGTDDYYNCDEDEITVYRISTWLCTSTLAVSLGSVLLLPISILSNEVLVYYPNSYYVQWLNSSLIQGLWNFIFLFSNVATFVCLPFAYLLTESEGFFGHRKGLWARVYETLIVLILWAVVMLGLAYILSALFNDEDSKLMSFFNLWAYLPFLYSCLSFLGVLILLVCTPLGFVHLFDVVGTILVKPQFLFDLHEEYSVYAFEKDCLIRRLKEIRNRGTDPIHDAGHVLPKDFAKFNVMEQSDYYYRKLAEIEMKRKILGKQRQVSSLRRNVTYPIAMLLLIGLTGIAVCLVAENTISLLIGIKALPSSSKQFTLGVSSLSKLGPVGAIMEIIMIVYFIATSSIGLYTAPYMNKIRPAPKGTSFILVIANCALVLIISSALPLLSKTLGITNFDLLGDFGSIEWLGNFKIVLLYNILFGAATSLCIVNKFTAKVRRELYARLVENYTYIANCASFLN